MALYLRAIRYFKNDRFIILQLCLLMFASIAIGLLQAWPMAVLVDVVLNPTPHISWIHKLFLAPLPHNRLAQVIGITLIGMCLKIVQDTIAMFRTVTNSRLRYNGLTRVRYALFQKIHELGLSYQKMFSQGDTIYRLQTDVEGIYGVLETVIATFVAGVMLLGMTAIMLSRHLTLTLCALSISPILLMLNVRFGPKIRSTAFASKQADADLTSMAQQSFSVLGVVQAFGRQRHERRRFGSALRRCSESGMAFSWQEALYPWARDIIFALGGAITFGYGGYLVYRNQFQHPTPNGLTVGDLMVVMAYFAQLWDPLSRLAGSGASLQGSAAAANRVFSVLDRRPAVVQCSNPIRLPLQARKLSFHDVAFGYEDGRPVLAGISAEIAAGESVAFVGPSGAGKSTLLQLSCRLFDPWSGSIRLDGIDLRDLDLQDVRRHTGIVPQDSPVLNLTMAENIAFARPKASFQEVIAAARLAGASEFIEQLPEGYDTVLAEGGQNVSGGQRQRLALARAVLADVPILVLDEPTSAQDPLHERALIGALRAMKGTRSTILMTHRLQAAADCDRIYVVDRGRVAECGTHPELLHRGGLYSEMWHSQVIAGESEYSMHPQAAGR